MHWRSPFGHIYPIGNQDELDMAWKKIQESMVNEIMIRVSYESDVERNLTLWSIALTAMLYGLT